MKKITFTKTEHNGVECWKDETGLFMVKKRLNHYGEKPKFDLFIAKRDCSQLTNECHSWGYEELYKKARRNIHAPKRNICRKNRSYFFQDYFIYFTFCLYNHHQHNGRSCACPVKHFLKK